MTNQIRTIVDVFKQCTQLQKDFREILKPAAIDRFLRIRNTPWYTVRAHGGQLSFMVPTPQKETLCFDTVKTELLSEGLYVGPKTTLVTTLGNFKYKTDVAMLFDTLRYSDSLTGFDKLQQELKNHFSDEIKQMVDEFTHLLDSFVEDSHVVGGPGVTVDKYSILDASEFEWCQSPPLIRSGIELVSWFDKVPFDQVTDIAQIGVGRIVGKFFDTKCNEDISVFLMEYANAKREDVFMLFRNDRRFTGAREREVINKIASLLEASK